MQYLDYSTGETIVVGEEEMCPLCGRPMLFQSFYTPTSCNPASWATCNQHAAVK